MPIPRMTALRRRACVPVAVMAEGAEGVVRLWEVPLGAQVLLFTECHEHPPHIPASEKEVYGYCQSAVFLARQLRLRAVRTLM